MMVKVMVYAYATGTFSSRKIARKLHEDIAFRVLGAGNFPAHRTIRDFRALHLAEFTELFTQVVRLAREMGLVKPSWCRYGVRWILGKPSAAQTPRWYFYHFLVSR
jgi:transposase